MSENEQKSTTCTVCGGVLQIEWTLIFNQMRPHEMRVEPEMIPPARLCPGHYPEQVTPHDGNLGDDHTVSMGTIRRAPSGKQEHGQGITIASYDEMICLDPVQVLSLMTWLLQHKSVLEEMAKEQEG